MKTYRLAAIVTVFLAISAGPGALPAEAASPTDPTPVGVYDPATGYVLRPLANGALPFTPISSSSGQGSLAPVVSTTAESSHVIKATKASFYDAYVTTGATAGFLLIFDSATDPGNGAVTPAQCIQAPANTSVGYSTDGMPPELYNNGVVVVFSTTGCFTETKSATAFFHVRAS